MTQQGGLTCELHRPPERLRPRDALQLFATTGNPAFARLWATLEAELSPEDLPPDDLPF